MIKYELNKNEINSMNEREILKKIKAIYKGPKKDLRMLEYRKKLLNRRIFSSLFREENMKTKVKWRVKIVDKIDYNFYFKNGKYMFLS